MALGSVRHGLGAGTCTGLGGREGPLTHPAGTPDAFSVSGLLAPIQSRRDTLDLWFPNLDYLLRPKQKPWVPSPEARTPRDTFKSSSMSGDHLNFGTTGFEGHNGLQSLHGTLLRIQTQ